MTRITKAFISKVQRQIKLRATLVLVDARGGGRYAFQPMGQLVFIVSRHRPKLHEYLQQEFADNAEVTVIVDRRLSKRRLQEVDRSPDRRQTDRRQALVDERLRSMGWAIVWRDESMTVCVPREDVVLLPPEGRTPPTPTP
jgi:hypothetical protein